MKETPMTEMITPELVSLDQDLGPDKAAVIRAMAERITAQGRATDADELFDAFWAREEKDATGIPGGIGIPHARSAAVSEPTLAMSRLTPGVDFGAGEADLVFAIAVPAGADDAHLQLLSTLARSLIREEFTAALREAASPGQIVSLVHEALDGGQATAQGAASASAAGAGAAGSGEAGAEAAGSEQQATGTAGSGPRIVAVTACATGIAHTFMAADALTAAAKRAEVDFHVEPQGSSSVTPLDPAVIDAADAVIFATDVDVRNPGRFAGKPVIQVPVKRGVDQPDELIKRAIAAIDDPEATRVSAQAASGEQSAKQEKAGARIQRWLMTGVSYMIPFVAGGGLLLALGFLLGGYSLGLDPDGDGTNIATDTFTSFTLFNLPPEGLGFYLGAVAFVIGAASMGFLVSALAGYIAFGIADRPGIAPGFVAGAISVLMGAGFIGGIVGGLLAGFIAWWLGTLRVPRFIAGLMPVVIIPLIGSIFASGIMALFLGGPIAALSTALTDWLNGLTGSGAVLLGIILGFMMCFDLGGPVNKVAYSFAVAGLSEGTQGNPAPWLIMAAVMASGMVPPIAMSVATFIAPKLFTPAERENGKAGWLLGLSFISEGAIPFAAADPLRVLPASMVGGAITGALSMAMGVTSQAPHGGIFVFFAIGNVLWFILSILIGAAVTCLLVIALKRFVRRSPLPGSETAAVSQPEPVTQAA